MERRGLRVRRRLRACRHLVNWLSVPPALAVVGSAQGGEALATAFSGVGRSLSEAPGRDSRVRPESPTGGSKHGLTTRSPLCGSLVRRFKLSAGHRSGIGPHGSLGPLGAHLPVAADNQ